MTAYRRFACRFDSNRASLFVVAIGLLGLGVSAWGQPRGIKDGEAIEKAPEVALQICRATAVRRDGKVEIRVSQRETRIANRAPDDKQAKPWVDCWTEMEPLLLGEQIRAYTPTGKKLDEAAVLTALANPSAVACLQRTHQTDPELPDPFYAGVFRDNLVILVFEAKYWLR